MNGLCSVAILASLLSADPQGDMAENSRWRQAFDRTAAKYELARGDADQNRLALIDHPTYLWARSGPDGGTYGAVYVWTHRGNAEAVACFWRYLRPDGTPSLVHELHSLSPVPLESQAMGSNTWKAQAGVERQLLKDAPMPASSAAGRLQQMRALCRDFSAHSVGANGDRTELRLLPQPLYRFHSANPEVVDGALFAFVCSVGTDPEVFLQLDAIQSADGPRWHFSAARFSHMNLFVEYRGSEVWKAIRDQDNPIAYNSDRTYWVFHQAVEDTVLSPSDK